MSTSRYYAEFLSEDRPPGQGMVSGSLNVRRFNPAVMVGSWTQNNNITLFPGQDSIYDGIGHVPTYDLAPRVPARIPNISTKSWGIDLLHTTLFIEAMYAEPGHVPSYDWQLPVPSRKRGISLRSMTQSLALATLYGLDQMYGESGRVGTYDWQLPVPARKQPISNKAYYLNLILSTLFGQDRMYGDIGQRPSYDLAPRVPPRPHPIALRTFIGFILGQDSMYADPGQVPGIADDPRWVERPPLVLDWFYNGTLYQPAVHPVGQIYYPDFVRGRKGINPTYFQNILTLGLKNQESIYGAPGQVPMYTYPGGRAPQRSVDLLTWIRFFIPDEEIALLFEDIILKFEETTEEVIRHRLLAGAEVILRRR